MQLTPIRSVLIACLLPVAITAAPERESGGRHTLERLANVVRNCERFEWAGKLRSTAVANAQPWVEHSDEALWSMVPGQNLPRCIDVTMDLKAPLSEKRLGCLGCGEKIHAFGNYPYEPDFAARPWKLTCPSCNAVFPTNDFGQYYASGIDARGVFDPAKADRRLLFNTAHPDPKDPLHTFGVDDGFGYIDKNGRAHRFIGYYTWKYWRHLLGGLTTLADAYVYTGDTRYAHKAAILLDRIADVYPEMDWSPYAKRGWFHSDGGSGIGKVEGRIWETSFATSLCGSYDKILAGTRNDPALGAFLQRQAERYQLPSRKGTRELFVKNVDEGILRTIFRSICAGQIAGNEGMHQRTAALAALALNTEPETSAWLDWLFAPDGGAIPGLIVGKLDRDGVSPEAGPGYALSWGVGFAAVATVIADYPAYTRHNIFRDYPQFRATFAAAYRLCVLGLATPNIGDAGTTGSIGRASVSPEFIATGYRYTRDPALAVAAYRANGNSGRGLGRDILAAEPDALAEEIDRLGQQAGPRPIASTLLSGYGLAQLETGNARAGAALALYYGRSIFHGHADHLNFDLLAFGAWLTPDHGYPEFATAWPHRTAVTINTLAHNTVVVDQKPQARNYGGHTRLFAQAPGLSVVQADARDCYPQTSQYTRTMLLIDAPRAGTATAADAPANTYAVDIFQVTGGSDHLYSFHGPPGAITADGQEFVAQSGGSYAGPDIPFKADRGPVGYSWWYNVRRAATPKAQFTLDWKTGSYGVIAEKDDVHLRFHSLTPISDAALAEADPPQNKKPANPRRLGYALLHRTGKTGLASTFVSVIEPYRGAPFIRSVERLDTGNDSQVVLRVHGVDGSVDHVLFNPTANALRLTGAPALTGLLGFTRETGGKVTAATAVRAAELRHLNAHLTSPAAYTGKIVAMNRQLDGGGWLIVDQTLPTDGSLVGRTLHIANHNERDASYTIRGVTRENGQSRIDCGSVSFVRNYAGPTATVRGQAVPRSYDQGYLFDFEVGAEFTIPLVQHWTH